ncbi:cytochrome P450 6B7-like [Odontomachus brunneus]|uniref:cytochrome P450 6B7-like n=1 Tax=Odontomachus brunneus TaxID=486640 RepID=UPI0013F23764|nr:cytochrome P450 6B7-like [Odontomachus brunneus]
MVIILFIFILGGLAASYFYLTKNYNYWRNRNIPFAKGILPGFGHVWSLLLMRITLADLIKQICSGYPNQSMVGFYYQTTPALVIREPELIKTVLQTNFASFSKNLWNVDPHLDRLLRVNPFFTYGDTWLISRRFFSLAFTSRYLKTYFNCIEQVCKKLENFLNDKLRKNNNVIELDLNKLASSYTTSVASLISFSVEQNISYEHESQSVLFANVAEKVFGPSLYSRIMQSFNFYFYDLKRLLRMSFIPKKVNHFFSTTVKEIIDIRQQEQSAHRLDFLQLMLNMKKNKEIEEDLIAAYVFTLFVNISDTSNVSLSFVVYQIARHPHVQQKLRDEVKSVLEKYDGRLTYDALKEMTYLDQVLKESQRVYSTASCLAKICTEEFELKGSDGLSCRVHPGTIIFINVHEMHKNPKYWPNPDVFDPDRFDKKTKINKYTFLPFGEGQRICVAMRLALLQSKAYLAVIMKNYTLEVSSKTPKEPFKFLPGRFLTSPVGRLWVHFKPLSS